MREHGEYVLECKQLLILSGYRLKQDYGRSKNEYAMFTINIRGSVLNLPTFKTCVPLCYDHAIFYSY